MWPRAIHVRYAHLHHRRKKGLSLWARLSPSMNTVSTVERSEARQNTCLQWMPEDFDVLMRGCGACITCSSWPSTFCGGHMKTPSARKPEKPHEAVLSKLTDHFETWTRKACKNFSLAAMLPRDCRCCRGCPYRSFPHEKHVLARSTRRTLAMNVPRCCGLMESWR